MGLRRCSFACPGVFRYDVAADLRPSDEMGTKDSFGAKTSILIFHITTVIAITSHEGCTPQHAPRNSPYSGTIDRAPVVSILPLCCDSVAALLSSPESRSHQKIPEWAILRALSGRGEAKIARTAGRFTGSICRKARPMARTPDEIVLMSMQGMCGIMEHDVQLQGAVLKQHAWCQDCYTGRMKN